ncbi:MAG: hypothetical protein ACFFDT_26335 [Candidatus Hodarchaeota archaeon]
MQSVAEFLRKNLSNQHYGLILWISPETPGNVIGGLGQVSTYVPALLAKKGWFIVQIGRGVPFKTFKENYLILRDPFLQNQVYPQDSGLEDQAIYSLADFLNQQCAKIFSVIQDIRAGLTSLRKDFPLFFIAHDHFVEPGLMQLFNDLRINGFKIIVEIHNEILGAYLGTLLGEKWNQKTINLVKKAKKTINKSSRHKRELSLFNRVREGMIDALLAPSQAMLDHYKQVYQLPDINMFRAPNGVPKDVFKPKPNQSIKENILKRKQGVCAWIGRPVPEKGLTQLFEELPSTYRAFVGLSLNDYVIMITNYAAQAKKKILVFTTTEPKNKLHENVIVDTRTIPTSRPKPEKFKEVLETFDFSPYDIIECDFWMPKTDLLSNITVFVGNSLYEPSGIIQLEATGTYTPSIVSKQTTLDGWPRSGMSEYYPNEKGIVTTFPEQKGSLKEALIKFLDEDFLEQKRRESSMLRDNITWEYSVQTFWIPFLRNMS